VYGQVSKSRRRPAAGFDASPHRRKVERFVNDPEVYQLYKRVVEKPRGYCPELRSCHCAVDRHDFDFGVEQREFASDDIDAAAGRLTP
jgi:hypothetical protein